jgi:hypothetical protein
VFKKNPVRIPEEGDSLVADATADFIGGAIMPAVNDIVKRVVIIAVVGTVIIGTGAFFAYKKLSA